MRTLSERVRLALDESGMNQAALADAARVSRASVTDWLNGETKALKAEPLVRAAHALGVSALWLATGEGLMRPSSGPFVVHESPAPYGRPPWPFAQLSESAICSMARDDRLRLEGALMAAINQLGMLETLRAS
jgi:transcriptional regulator with XRE-family HTH domain